MKNSIIYKKFIYTFYKKIFKIIFPIKINWNHFLAKGSKEE
jgi:hypothetical protein